MLSSKEKLDVQTIWKCKRNGLLNLEDILQYYLNNGNFRKLKLRNDYTNNKLIAICEKYSCCPLNLYFRNENQIESKGEGTTKEIPNFSLNELAHADGLSNRAITCCSNYKLTNLGKILHFYYVDKESFSQLRNCGKNTEEELVRICEKYSDFVFKTDNPSLQKIQSKVEGITKEIPNYSLDDLAQMDGLSIRSINSCLNYELTNLEKILHFYYVEKESFKKLRCCGKNTENELIRICEKYSDFAIKTINPLLQEIESKDEVITNEIQNFYLNEFAHIDGLSARSITICLNCELTNLVRILHFYFVEKKSFLSLKNCGKKSNLELINFCNYYKNYAIVQKTLEIPGLQRKRYCAESKKKIRKSKQSYWYMRIDHNL